MENMAVLLWALGAAVVALILLRLMQPLILLGHELGHAIPALIFSRSRVDVRFGDLPDDPPSRTGGSGLQTGDPSVGVTGGQSRPSLGLNGSWRARRASTSYDASGLGRWERTGIALGGPLATLVGVVLGLSAALATELPLVARFLGAVVAWGHLKMLIYVLWPGSGGHAARGGDARDLARIWGRGP